VRRFAGLRGFVQRLVPRHITVPVAAAALLGESGGRRVLYLSFVPLLSRPTPSSVRSGGSGRCGRCGRPRLLPSAGVKKNARPRLRLHAFGALDALSDLPTGPEGVLPVISEKTSERGQRNNSRGRVDIVRQTAHRGGKAVTIVKNFTDVDPEEKRELAKMLRKACGVGGSLKDGCIEIQGDKRDEVKRILSEEGFKPVFSGG